jgi:hypothetical protein
VLHVVYVDLEVRLTKGFVRYVLELLVEVSCERIHLFETVLEVHQNGRNPPDPLWAIFLSVVSMATSPRAPVRSCKVLHCQRGEPSWCALWRCLISNGTPWRHHGWAPGDVEKMWNLDSMQTYASFMLTACTTLAHQIRSDISMDHPVGLG